MDTKEESKNLMLENKNNIMENVLKYLPVELRNLIGKIKPEFFASLEEIRLRANKPLMVENADGDWFVDQDSNITKVFTKCVQVKQEDIFRTLESMSQNSIYAFSDEIRNGFITLRGGHRVGITGRTVLENNNIKNIKDVSALNIRISREVKGCSQKIIRYILKNNQDIYNTLIISPPQCGKTTMLRDIARLLSDGIGEMQFKGVKVGVVDERSEIGACFKGIAQNNLGVRTDILDGCPKIQGMNMMLRSMSPYVIITDEIGNKGDFEAVMQVVNAGVKIITSAHGYNISELKAREEVLRLIEEKTFDRYIVLDKSDGPGTIREVLDANTMKVLED